MTEARLPKKFFVTRHPGAVSWYRQSGYRAETIKMDNFDVSQVVPGDIVIGTLPMHQAAAVCTAGGRFYNLVLDVPPAHRGRELTADDMREFGARLEEFRLEWLGQRESRTRSVEDGVPPETDGPALHVCVATGETLANLVPAMQLKWAHAAILATPEMLANAMHLQILLECQAELRGVADPSRRRDVPAGRR